MLLDLEPYLRFEAEQVSPRVSAWLSPHIIREHLRREVGDEVAQRLELERAERYRRHCPVPAGDYMLRELDLGTDGRVLAGIHFIGMDVRHPFVGVLARTRALAEPSAVKRVGHRLQQEFAHFEPASWRLWCTQADAALEQMPGARVDMLVIAGRLGELRARPARPAAALALALQPCQAADVYAEYWATYDRFFEAHPEWRGRIQVESEERLHEAENAGVLLRALVDDRRAGFFAALPARERALVGFVMLEAILDTPFRGRGLAVTLQRLLLDHVAALGVDPSTIVFGHIDHENAPSLRTALAVGRHEVYRTVYLPFE